jgi:hypothetical protein
VHSHAGEHRDIATRGIHRHGLRLRDGDSRGRKRGRGRRERRGDPDAAAYRP